MERGEPLPGRTFSFDDLPVEWPSGKGRIHGWMQLAQHANGSIHVARRVWMATYRVETHLKSSKFKVLVTYCHLVGLPNTAFLLSRCLEYSNAGPPPHQFKLFDIYFQRNKASFGPKTAVKRPLADGNDALD